MDYECISKHYKLVTINLNKQIELENSDLKQQTNFIGKLEDDRATTMISSLKNSEKNNFWIFTKFCEYHIKWKHKQWRI